MENTSGTNWNMIQENKSIESVIIFLVIVEGRDLQRALEPAAQRLFLSEHLGPHLGLLGVRDLAFPHEAVGAS